MGLNKETLFYPGKRVQRPLPSDLQRHEGFLRNYGIKTRTKPVIERSLVNRAENKSKTPPDVGQESHM